MQIPDDSITPDTIEVFNNIIEGAMTATVRTKSVNSTIN